MKINPQSDRIIVRRLDADSKSKGGLHIPEVGKEKPTQATVVAVGPGRTTPEGKVVEPRVKAGDRVLFGKYSGNEVTLDGVEYLIIREDDVLAVLE